MGVNMSMGLFESQVEPKLSPNYTMDNQHSICSTKMKQLYSKKFQVKEHEQSTIPDVLLDCEYMDDILYDDVPEEWSRIHLDDMITSVFTPHATVSHNDVEEFFNTIYSEIRFEEEDFETEEETES